MQPSIVVIGEAERQACKVSHCSSQQQEITRWDHSICHHHLHVQSVNHLVHMATTKVMAKKTKLG